LLIAVAGKRGAFVVAGLFLPVVVLGSWSLVRRLDANVAVPTDVLDLLLEVPILAVLPPRIIERLAIEAVGVDATAGTPLITEGDAGDRFYVLASGDVVVSRGGEHLRSLGTGDWFGELALLRDVPRTASVVAATDVHLCALGRDSFLAAVGGSARSVQTVEDHASDYL